MQPGPLHVNDKKRCAGPWESHRATEEIMSQTNSNGTADGTNLAGYYEAAQALHAKLLEIALGMTQVVARVQDARQGLEKLTHNLAELAREKQDKQ